MNYQRICSLSLLFFGLLFTGCENASTIKQGELKTTDLDNSQTSTMTDSDSKENAVSRAKGSADHFVIDVRSKEEWDDGHLETAIHIPHTEIAEGIKNITVDNGAKIYLH